MAELRPADVNCPLNIDHTFPVVMAIKDFDSYGKLILAPKHPFEDFLVHIAVKHPEILDDRLALKSDNTPVE